VKASMIKLQSEWDQIFELEDCCCLFYEQTKESRTHESGSYCLKNDSSDFQLHDLQGHSRDGKTIPREMGRSSLRNQKSYYH